jgi:hypothetical protein
MDQSYHNPDEGLSTNDWSIEIRSSDRDLLYKVYSDSKSREKSRDQLRKIWNLSEEDSSVIQNLDIKRCSRWWEHHRSVKL